jgi:hypothetical protein
VIPRRGSGYGLIEWYRNDEEGLEQGFTLQSRVPSKPDGGPLQIDLVFDGDLIPKINRDGTAIEFYDAASRSVLRYGSLVTLDAQDRSLPTWFSLDDKSISLIIDDTDAVYPIEVDPTLNGLPGSDNWSITSLSPDEQFGFSVAAAGDVDGDGYSEVIIGIPYYDHGQAGEGAVFVYFGSDTGLKSYWEWIKESDQSGAHFGWSVATAGDVNGDGFSDIIVGAPEYTHGQNNEGGAWVYKGSRDGLIYTPYNFDESNQAGARFGYSVATAGDVNGDGFSDIIVGAPYYYRSEFDVDVGRVWVLHGSDTGVSPSHNWRAEGRYMRNYLGCSVATAGDVNRDGYADVIVGAPGYESGNGAAMVWHGSLNGVNNDVDGDPDNTDWLKVSDQNDTNLGVSVSTAGDVNGDGFSDVIIGANLYNNGQINEGAAWIYHGSDTGLNNSWSNMDEGNVAGAWFGYSVSTAGDVNGDGYADVIVGAPFYTGDETEEGRAFVWHGSNTGISSTRDWDVGGEEERAWLGQSVATAGDVNGDGYSDVIVGAPGHNSSAGKVYVYHGSPGSVDGRGVWEKFSNQGDSLFGFSVGTAGDVDGDGHANIIVGAPYWDDGQTNERGAWVYHGIPDSIDPAPRWHKESGQNHAQFGYSVGTAGDINNDGYSEVIVRAPFWTAGSDDEGGAWVYAGSNTGLASPLS